MTRASVTTAASTRPLFARSSLSTPQIEEHASSTWGSENTDLGVTYKIYELIAMFQQKLCKKFQPHYQPIGHHGTAKGLGSEGFDCEAE